MGTGCQESFNISSSILNDSRTSQCAHRSPISGSVLIWIVILLYVLLYPFVPAKFRNVSPQSTQHSKVLYQSIPEDVGESYFAGKRNDELVFGEMLDLRMPFNVDGDFHFLRDVRQEGERPGLKLMGAMIEKAPRPYCEWIASRVSEIDAHPKGALVVMLQELFHIPNFPIINNYPLMHGRFLQLCIVLRRPSRSPSCLSLPINDFQSTNRNNDADNSREEQPDIRKILRRKQTTEIAFRVTFGPIVLSIGCLLIYYDPGIRWNWGFVGIWLTRLLGVVFVGSGLGAFFLPVYWQEQCDYDCEQIPFHTNTVPQKYLLTSSNYWGTVIAIGRAQMANVLATEKQATIIGALAEGSGIRQIERMTGVHRDTIMRLGVRVGEGCASLLDSKMRGLSCEHLQFDELWGFIGKKQRHVQQEDSPELGDVWTFCAIDSDTKLVPAFMVGKRDSATANAFVSDVASRLANRVQVSTDALSNYVEAMELAFGANVDYAQIVKVFESQAADAEVVRVDKTRLTGSPDMALASTSHVERLNGTTRLHMRRLTRLTYAFSKKLDNFKAAVALHFAYYNFVKRHNTLRCTPAMAAGIERDFWTVKDLVEAA